MPDETSDPNTSKIVDVSEGSDGLRMTVARKKPIRLLSLEVQDSLPIADAAPPHLVWDHMLEEASQQEPALILHKTPLKLKVTFKSARSLDGPCRLVGEIRGEGVSLEVSLEVDGGALSGTWDQTFESATPMSPKVAVHELEVSWFVEHNDKRIPINERAAPLRIYTIHKAPVKNTTAAEVGPHVSKAHLEHACAWAEGATDNIGQGARSIAHRVNNAMRHYVHPDDWREPDQHYASVYPPGSAKPANYADLEGGTWHGKRSVSSLYYPPLKPTKPYEEYHPHYETNFGWKLLDNPTHTGGRCNQQAALYCEILGVLGIKASVYYLHRVGNGKRTGRPMRRFFNCYKGGSFWNFHGIAKVELDDGSFHMYDGSFSSPPNRKNGDEAWAIGERGPFIYSWSPYWRYADNNTNAPEDDWPETWEGVP